MCDLHIYGLLSECWKWSLSASCDTETLLQTSLPPAARGDSAEISCSNSAAGGINLLDVYSINYLKINFKVDHYLFLTHLTFHYLQGLRRWKIFVFLMKISAVWRLQLLNFLQVISGKEDINI